MACYTTYRTCDDRYISVGAHELKFWSSFCGIIGLAELIPDHVASPERQREMMRIVGQVIATRTREEWVEVFRGQDVPVEPVLGVEEAIADPQILQRQMIVEPEFPEVGKVKQIGFPIELSDTPGTIRSPAVPSGRDSQAVLRGLGLSQEPSLCTFIQQLNVPLSAPQWRHLTNSADALLMCETEKTLAALHRQFVESVDPSNKVGPSTCISTPGMPRRRLSHSAAGKAGTSSAPSSPTGS